MISACIADPFAIRLRIRGFDVDAFTVPSEGRKRQAAPSPHKIYRGQMDRVNQGLAGAVPSAARPISLRCPSMYAPERVAECTFRSVSKPRCKT